jgi:hypothetical protein
MSDSNFDFTKNDGKKRRQRNLRQYKDLSDEQFEEVIAKKALGIEPSVEFEKRISKKWAEFEEDYDLSDLKINDRDTLRALIQTQISLEDCEQLYFKIRSEGLSENQLFSTEKLSKTMSDLRADISKMNNDLNITRKVRKSDQDVSVLAYIESLRKKAKEFAESKYQYIFCPKCNMLLASVWTLYPHNDRNKIALICERDLGDGQKCGEKVIVSTAELLKNRGTNKLEITPESMR